MLKIGFRKLFFNKEIAICVLTLFGATAATAMDGSEIFKRFCTPCHGMNGEGKKPMGPPLKGSEFIKTSSDADVKKTIQNGRGGIEKKFKDFPAPMPPQKSLTETELDALVKYLKDLNGITPLNAEESVPLPLPVAPEQRQEEANEHKESFGFEDLIGKEFTASKLIGQRKDKSIEKFIHRYLDYYVSLDDFKEKRMNNKESAFIISEIVPQGFSQYYKIKFKSGKEGYIEVNKLAEGFSLFFYECGNCENIGEPSGEILLEAMERRSGADILKERGVSKGSYLWLKYSRFDLPWLAKVRITDCTVKIAAPPLELLFETDGKEYQIGFYLTKGQCQSTSEGACFDDTFYVTDPAPRIAKWGKRVLTAIKENKVFIGMRKEQVRASWGVPDDNNRTVGPWGVHEQWIYGDNGSYLYFQNDKLTSWQD